VTIGFGCSLLEYCSSWDWLVETAVLGDRLEDPRADIIGVPCDGDVGVLHRFMLPMIVIASSVNWPRSSRTSYTPTSLGVALGKVHEVDQGIMRAHHA
jgi:hypothetical protein